MEGYYTKTFLKLVMVVLYKGNTKKAIFKHVWKLK